MTQSHKDGYTRVEETARHTNWTVMRTQRYHRCRLQSASFVCLFFEAEAWAINRLKISLENIYSFCFIASARGLYLCLFPYRHIVHILSFGFVSSPNFQLVIYSLLDLMSAVKWFSCHHRVRPRRYLLRVPFAWASLFLFDISLMLQDQTLDNDAAKCGLISTASQCSWYPKKWYSIYHTQIHNCNGRHHLCALPAVDTTKWKRLHKHSCVYVCVRLCGSRFAWYSSWVLRRIFMFATFCSPCIVRSAEHED